MTKIIIFLIVIGVLLIIFVPSVSVLFKKTIDSSSGYAKQAIGFFNKLWQERRSEVIKEFNKETQEMAVEVVGAGKLIVEKWQWIRSLAK